jgi:hypothetical protein
MTTSFISQSFNTFKSYCNKAQNNLCAAAEKGLNDSEERQLIGAFGGFPTAVLATTTGPMVALHEVIGHGFLGFDTTYTYGSGEKPHFWVLGWDNFRDMTKAGSFKDWLTAFFHWITGGNGNGAAGLAYPGRPDGLTPAGHAMGTDGQRAWISIAGSLPALALDSLAVVGGMCLRKRSPMLGSMFVTMGLTDNLLNSGYAIDAATMNNAELKAAANQGHDFANFAVRMGSILHLPAEAVAISTAAIWMGFVPLLALGAYLHTKSHLAEAVPDTLAIQHWLTKAQTDPKIANELKRHFDSFPAKDKFRSICSKTTPDSKEETQQIQKYALDFLGHLLTQIPSKSLENCKSEILESWAKHAKPNRLQTAFTCASVAGSATSIATKFLQVLSQAAFPALSTAATVLTYASPLFAIGSTLSTAYQVYNDFKCPDSVIPKSAKMLSVARLVSSIACAALITVSLFVPGLNGVFMGALFAGALVSVVLAYARSRIVQHQFAKSHATQPDTWNVMHALWLKHKAHPTATTMSPVLQRWVDLVQPEKK